MGAGGTGFDDVEDVMLGNNSRIIEVGDFTAVNSVAMKHVAEWNGSSWAAVGTGLVSDGHAVIQGPSTATFTADGATVRRRSGSSWISEGVANSTVYCLGLNASDELIAGGQFTTIDGVSATRIARRDSSGTWHPYGSGLDDRVLAIVGTIPTTSSSLSSLSSSSASVVPMAFDLANSNFVGGNGTYCQRELAYESNGSWVYSGTRYRYYRDGDSSPRKMLFYSDGSGGGVGGWIYGPEDYDYAGAVYAYDGNSNSGPDPDGANYTWTTLWETNC